MSSACVPLPVAVAPQRLRQVDSLRAVAAGLVVWLHFGRLLAPRVASGSAWLGFLQTWPHAIDLGRIGVMIFFAISGFVICRSFSGPREGGARRFLIKRFCRLYPAYWASMLGGVLVWWSQGWALSWSLLTANATMIPDAFGQSPLLGVYWTLEIELLFYGLCLCLYCLRWLDRPLVLAAGVLALVWLPRTLNFFYRITGTHQRISLWHTLLALSLATMFWGSLFRLVYDETGGFRRPAPRPWLVGLLVLLTLALIDVPDPNLKWVLLGWKAGPLPGQAAMACAVVVFTLWVAWLRVDHPALAFLGTISYSLYLFHLVVVYAFVHLAAASGSNLPFPALFAAGGVVSVALAALAYRWVERPANALGKRWANAFSV